MTATNEALVLTGVGAAPPMVCLECGELARRLTGDRPFSESGLANLVLIGVTYSECPNGHAEIEIPNPHELFSKVAESIILKPFTLAGAEIRFLRKRLEMTAKAYASLVGLSDVHLSRLENSAAAITPTVDRVARLLYAQHLAEGHRHVQLLNVLKEVREANGEDYEHRVRLIEDVALGAISWRVERGQVVKCAEGLNVTYSGWGEPIVNVGTFASLLVDMGSIYTRLSQEWPGGTYAIGRDLGPYASYVGRLGWHRRESRPIYGKSLGWKPISDEWLPHSCTTIDRVKD